MAVHMIRVLCQPPMGDAETAINNWVSNYNEWQADPITHQLVEDNTAIDGSGVAYLRGDWRFIDDGEDPTNILDDLSARLQDVQGGLWHRLGYHVCTHDETDVHACSWDESAEFGDVSSGIPTF